jgi:serine/threonine protein kinase
MADTIEEAHTAKLIHRDLKPANIMLTGQGHVKVMDFGLARRLHPNEHGETLSAAQDAQLTAAGIVVGTPDYMSPEQLTGAPLDGRSDLFAFGIILCELLIGKHPFRRGSGPETMSAILRDAPSLSVSGSGVLSPGLMVLIRRLLAKAPDERYRSMTEVRTDLGTQTVPGAAEALQWLAKQIGRDAERDQLLRHLDAALARPRLLRPDRRRARHRQDAPHPRDSGGGRPARMLRRGGALFGGERRATLYPIHRNPGVRRARVTPRLVAALPRRIGF